MSSSETIRNSILCEHTIRVAKHDHSKQNDTLRGYCSAERSKDTLTELNRYRYKTLVNALKLGFMKKLLANELME
jgi:hypothetical protein